MDNWTIGLFLCEAHHSLLRGRKKRYWGELSLDKTLSQMRSEVEYLEARVLEGQTRNKG